MQVYRAVLSGMTSVAVKVLHEHDEDMNFGREIAILRSCRHSNIVQFLVRCRISSPACTMSSSMDLEHLQCPEDAFSHLHRPLQE